MCPLTAMWDSEALKRASTVYWRCVGIDGAAYIGQATECSSQVSLEARGGLVTQVWLIREELRDIFFPFSYRTIIFASFSQGVYMIPKHVATLLHANAIHQGWYNRKLERARTRKTSLSQYTHPGPPTCGFLWHGTNKALTHLNYSVPVSLCLEPNSLVLMDISTSYYKWMLWHLQNQCEVQS